MRVWLAIMVLALVLTGAAAVYLVDHPPEARARDPSPDADAPAEPTLAPWAPVDASSALAPPAPPPAGLEGGIVPDPDPVLAPATPFADAGADASSSPPEDAGEDAPAAPPEGPAPPAGGDPGGAADDPPPADDGEEEPPADEPPTPRSWTWTHDYASGSGPPVAFGVPAGLSELEYEVVFKAASATVVPTVAAVQADLVGPTSAVARVPCSPPKLLTGSYVCGPFRAPAVAGQWEVQYGGSGLVTATLSLRELA